ncbi:hypothetical protein [Cyclobacterium jeungdonense]|uniref:hypothetical protein n=1 Tax=Cyclobacterium jeungdonense TaxID=708087 RepID=UPI0033900906
MLCCHFAKSPSERDISNGLRSATWNLILALLKPLPNQVSAIRTNEVIRSFSDLFSQTLVAHNWHLNTDKSKII